jgi:hypothetical protein
MILPAILPHATDLGGAIAHAVTPMAGAVKQVTDVAVPVRDFVGGLDFLHVGQQVGDYFSTIRNSAIESIAQGAEIDPNTAKNYVDGIVPAGFVADGIGRLAVLKTKFNIEKTGLKLNSWLKSKQIETLTALNERGSFLTTQSLKLNNWLTHKANAVFNRVG